MSRFQRFVQRLFGPARAAKMEAESRQWMLRCPDGHERSLWEAGGIRWGGRGVSATLLRCPTCRRVRWHTLHRKRAGDAADAQPAEAQR